MAHDNELVTAMDDRARAIFDEARETLARTADVRVERRAYHDDDALLAWRRDMPEPEPTPTAAATETRVTPRVVATVIHEVRQQLRGEFSGSLAKLRKLVAEDRTLARHELNRQRADHDRQRASMLAEIEHQRAKIAALELRVEALTHEASKRTIDGRVIDLPARRG